MARFNWRQNLQQRGGFWKNGFWYDLHLERRMPLAIPMIEELLVALPPLDEQAAVCDLGCGTGNTAFALLTTYPIDRLTLIDQDPQMLDIALIKLGDLQMSAETYETTLDTNGDPLPGGPYDLVLSTLALSEIVGADIDPAEAESRYELLFQSIFAAIEPGGHLLVGDHVGTLGLFRQLKAMERAGFVDIDCAWRQDDFFVSGARVPG